MDKLFSAALIYFSTISVVTAFLTVFDKVFAKKNMRRIPEATLLSFALFGGALSEYIFMKLIRHKTLHKKFMIGLPVIILLQTVFLGVMLYFIILN